jgi:CheY-like chemotaxis protein
MSPRVKCLLVDDLEENLLALSALLRREDVEILQARSAAAALELLLVHDVALAFLDVQMPEMDGFEAVAAIRLREQESGRHVPIVALTAHAMAGDRERCLGSGFDDYLSKPIQSATLRASLDGLDGPGAGHPEAGPGELPDDHHAFDRRSAPENLGGDAGPLDEDVDLSLPERRM